MPRRFGIPGRAGGALAFLLGLCLLPVAAVAEGGRLVEMDFRLVMAAMAQRVGGNGQFALYQAQGRQEPRALVVVGGRLELDALGPKNPALQSGLLVSEAGGGILARTPLVVWEGAELALGPGTELHLSRSEGAFLASFGRLTLDGARVAGRGEAPAGNAEFRPFVLVAGTGVLTARDSRFEALGFDLAPAYAGVAVINRGIFPAVGCTEIRDTRLEAVGSLLLEDTEGATLAGNRIEAAQGAGIWLRRTRDLRLVGNRVVTPSGHGIRLSAGAARVQLLDNEITDAGEAGIFADTGSGAVLIRGNRIEGAAGDAISIKRSDCVSIRDNVALRAGGSGIRLRRSTAVEIRDNHLSRNAGAGVLVEDQPQRAETRLEGNRLAGNSRGLAGANAGAMRLLGNDFTDQFPRLLDGDLVYLARDLLGDLHGRNLLLLAPHGTALSGFRSDCPVMEGY
ncbi:right-handed parallel beta-helix repeat-containing protein [Tropicimonas sediminicola]|uniref:Right handed beta helix region n=1 Tax=Tropicimonas sediminicola TaxID=1031541 RepID=A0A239MJS0_9RHOB|nr:right-handed parallel beta-helix repeat-containing protein [Tropicimonas sediminicola]SNT42905.1 Right handed beta helix region [Tropicimonas sediminicola]